MRFNHNGLPVEIALDDLKPNPLGGYNYTRCPECGDSGHLSDSDIMNAGKVIGSLAGQPSAFEAVAKCYALAIAWNGLVQEAEDGKLDYVEYAAKVAGWTQLKATWSFPFTTRTSTSLQLNCGHRVSISFGEDLAVAKEPDKVATLLKLGIHSEKSYRWVKYSIVGEAPTPLDYGKRKAQELVDFVDSLEKEKQAIIETSAKLLDVLSPLKATFAYKRDIASAINVSKEADIKRLREAQVVELSKLDTVLQRVALRG